MGDSDANKNPSMGAWLVGKNLNPDRQLTGCGCTNHGPRILFLRNTHPQRLGTSVVGRRFSRLGAIRRETLSTAVQAGSRWELPGLSWLSWPLTLF